MNWLTHLSYASVMAIAIALAAVRYGLNRIKIGPAGLTSSLGEYAESLLIVWVLVFGIVQPFFAQWFFIPSPSMVPTLQIGDHLVANKLVYRFEEPHRGDIVVFRAPPQADPDQKDFIKRCVAIPGDTVVVRDGRIIVRDKGGKIVDSGSRAQDPYLEDPFVLYDHFEFDRQHPDLTRFKVPPGAIWVMGDNRNNSEDSHIWGPLEESRIIGKASFIYWPPSRLRVLK